MPRNPCEKGTAMSDGWKEMQSLREQQVDLMLGATLDALKAIGVNTWRLTDRQRDALRGALGDLL